MTRASIIIALWILSGCTAPPPEPVAYDRMPGYLPAYPQYARLGQGGIDVCH